MGINKESKDLAEEALQRSSIYGFLARIFRKELTLDMLAEIKAPDFKKVLSDMKVKLGDDFFSEPEAKLIEDYAEEYTWLFLGPGKHLSPHESVNYERDDGDWGKFWGASTVEVKKFIESLGLHYKESDKSIPDHISVELELMQKVIEKERQAWAENNEKDALHYLKIEKLFMDDHIIKWIPDFCDKVTADARMSFYGEMAKLTKSFIELEEKKINTSLPETKEEVKPA
jgi:TorA maturation chaperone TorD